MECVSAGDTNPRRTPAIERRVKAKSPSLTLDRSLVDEKTMKISHIVALVAVSSASAFSVGSSPETSRRSWLAGGVAALVAGVPCAVSAALGKGTPVGREIDTFTSLIYNFKNTDLTGGLDASTLKEPSVPFIEFGEKMLKKEVEFVEFMAPSGDVAYVTFKAGKGQKKKEPIRIGQGYPINKKGILLTMLSG